MSSTRLPGKVLRPLGDRTVLEWVLRAAQAAAGLDAVAVATSGEAEDDAVAAVAAGVPGVTVVRGPVHDVLTRYVQAVDALDRQLRAETVGSRRVDAVVRLTADCPLLDPEVIDLVARTWRASPGLDHLATTNPRCLPRGLDVEVVSRRTLAEVDRYAAGADRVHVTSAVYRQPDRYAVAGLVLHPRAADLRVTLDVPADAALLDALVPLLPPGPPPWRTVVELLRARPDLVALNAGVRQKDWSEG